VPTDSELQIVASPRIGDPLTEALRVGGEVGILAIEFATRRRARFNGMAQPGDGTLIRVKLREVYGNCPRFINAEHELRITARDGSSHNLGTQLTPAQQEWVQRADTLFVATFHPTAGADASHRGGHPGFVKVVNSRRLLIPDYSGNTMFNTLGNIAVQPRTGLTFVNFVNGSTLQLSGRAKILWDGPELQELEGAERALLFDIDEVVEIGATP
jgi:predicted pyridoxine 5'-phosphate oxidase superfamily flavin-nucleotide-binding protein